MKKPQVYFVDGTAVAAKGTHVFKGVIASCGSNISKLEEVASVIKLVADSDGLYYLQKEGSGDDFAEKYLMASKGITACGCFGQDGSISSILSPISAYKDYIKGIQGIKKLLEVKHDARELDFIHMRLLFIGVCGEMEGYLHSTIIALIQGVKDVFVSLRECSGLPKQGDDEMKWKINIAHIINENFQFQHIRNRGSKERELYEKLLGEHLIISQELIDCIEWRNKLAHHVSYKKKPFIPSKEDIYDFIAETDNLVNYINFKIGPYKVGWLD